jgi:putative transposase
MSLQRTGYRYRLTPTPEQAAALERWAGCARAVWNAALEQRQLAWQMCGTSLRYESQGGDELATAKREHPWLREPHSDVLQQALRDLDRAFLRFFRREARYPRFKRKGRDSFRIQNRGAKGHIEVRRLARKVGEVRVPKLGWMRFRWTREPLGKITHLTISRDALGWHVSLCCQMEVEAPAARVGPSVGIDRGVVAVVATSAGDLFAMPALPPGQAERLRRLQRKAGRQETTRRRRANGERRRSRRHQRTLEGIARLRAREARIRADFLHKLSTNLAKSHGAVVLEKLDVVAMTRSARGSAEEPGTRVAAKRGLNRAILGSGWGELRRHLAYKCQRHGSVLMEVPAAYSSQECAECRAIDPANRRGRLFHCVACGHADDADINAARVILARAISPHEDGGRAVRRSAGSRRPGPGCEPRTPDRPAA